MRYLLDTDTVSLSYDASREPEHSRILRRLSLLREFDILLVSVLSLYELEYSFENAPPDKVSKIRGTIEDLKRELEVAGLKMESSSLFGQLKANLRRKTNTGSQQMKKHNIDLMIASTAIAEGAVLISADSIYPKLAEIEPRLRYENWAV